MSVPPPYQDQGQASAAPYGQGLPPQGAAMQPQPYGIPPQGGVYMQQPVYGQPQQTPMQMQMQQPVTTQQPMALLKPEGIPNCPPGLEYLAQLDQLLVKQQVEILEMFTGFETQNKYKVQNVMGQPVYFAREESGICVRLCCGPIRNFEMTICDNLGQEVIRLDRPLRCQSCWCFCCLQRLEVQSPPGTTIGTIEQDWSMIFPNFSIKDENGNTILKIRGPCWTWSCCGNDVVFSVNTPDGVEVGKISKQWSGIGREAFTDSDNFGITFPPNLEVKHKAILLGAVFLIDFMFFETSNNQQNDGFGMGS